MLAVSSLIDFLMNLLRDEAAQAEFERDPQGVLARAGLDDLCGQDVRDAMPILADHHAVHAKSGAHYTGSSHHGDDDPVRQIVHIKEHYEVNQAVVVNESNAYNYTYIDDRDTIVAIDDRDTTTITADGDVTIDGSFNQDTDVSVTQIEDSFNQDNDGVDNKGGVIDDSVVAGDDINDSLNKTDNSTNVDDSFNTDNSTDVDGSFNTDNSTDVDADDSFNTDSSTTQTVIDDLEDDSVGDVESAV